MSKDNSDNESNSSEKTHLDVIDRNIIAILKEDARTSYRSIAETIGKTEATVRRRVNTLIHDKLIKKFRIKIF